MKRKVREKKRREEGDEDGAVGVEGKWAARRRVEQKEEERREKRTKRINRIWRWTQIAANGLVL